MRQRIGDYALLLMASVLTTVPGLGGYSLWDVDEGVNAQAAREMAEADTWIVPTFNYALRTAKPVLLYWLQRLSYAALGVSEWSARLPSAVCGWLAVLLTYELGRRLWDRTAGLWGGVILASAAQFIVLARAATPDASLLLCTVLTFYAFWRGQENGGRRWWHTTAVACGLAVLTKGPIGIGLPAMVIISYWLWQKQIHRLWDKRLLTAAGLFLLVAGPWYALVASETRGEWVKAFITRENFERFARPMEGHHGPVFYYLLVLPVMFAPWSVWLLPVLVDGLQQARRGHGVVCPSPVGSSTGAQPPCPTDDNPSVYRFILCWIAAWLVVFSAAATKLPNYIFPLYPALALLTGRWLARWQAGGLTVAPWVVRTALALFALIGLVTCVGLIVAHRWYAGLAFWSWSGLLLVIGAATAYRAWRQGKRVVMTYRLAVAAVAFGAVTAAGIPLALDRHRAPKLLVQHSGIADPYRDLRVGSYRWFAPSLVFYSGREVTVVPDEAAARQFLDVPTPAYLFLPASVWEVLLQQGDLPAHQCLARHYDLLARTEIVVLGNAAVGPELSRLKPPPTVPSLQPQLSPADEFPYLR